MVGVGKQTELDHNRNISVFGSQTDIDVLSTLYLI
jgi:hypothetical protein